MSVGDSNPLHIETPTIKSTPISKLAGFDVYLKLENLQIPGSFKIRGIGNLISKAVERGCKEIVCASGGNAGLAAAYAARQLNVPAIIVLPQTTPGFVADKLRDEGATVKIHGKVWDESNVHALEIAKDPEIQYIHPFDHPDVWAGHSSMMKEAAEQMPCQPDAVVVSVGGGGLLNGVLEGMWAVGWQEVPCIALETQGANCLNAALKQGCQVTLPDITSVAKCLGALTICQTTLDYIKKHKNFYSVVVEDRQAVDACLKFADDHRILVEPACGASLAAVYGDAIHDLKNEGKFGPIKSALVIVCGGSSVTLAQLEKWKSMFNL